MSIWNGVLAPVRISPPMTFGLEEAISRVGLGTTAVRRSRVPGANLSIWLSIALGSVAPVASRWWGYPQIVDS